MPEPQIITFGGVKIFPDEIKTKTYNSKTKEYSIVFNSGVEARYKQQDPQKRDDVILGEPYMVGSGNIEGVGTITDIGFMDGVSVFGTGNTDTIRMHNCNAPYVNTMEGNEDCVTFEGCRDSFHGRNAGEDKTIVKNRKM